MVRAPRVLFYENKLTSFDALVLFALLLMSATGAAGPAKLPEGETKMKTQKQRLESNRRNTLALARRLQKRLRVIERHGWADPFDTPELLNRAEARAARLSARIGALS